MQSKRWLVVLAVGVVVVTVAASNNEKLPERLAGYRSWTLTAEPHLVAPEIAMMCAPVAAFREKQKDYGPHEALWVRVYANAIAAEAMKKDDLTTYPAGSIIVKEKLFDQRETQHAGVAFMIKHEKGELPESDGWEFLFYPQSGDAGAMTGCVSCHRTGAKRDYVFGKFERE